MEDYHFYEPDLGHGLAHDPLLAIVGPRPIGWISTQGADGIRNLAPYSFFNVLSSKPPLLAFGSGALKDSVRNVEETGEFVWNLVTRDLAIQMNESSAVVPIDADEFELAGLAAAPCRLVSAPRVDEAAVAMECRATEILRLKDVAGEATEVRLVVGQVVGIHIHRRLLKDGVYDTAAAQPILRAGGSGDYFQILPEGHFIMPRPGT